MNDSRRLLILADDFTGACDAAAAFARSRGTLVVHGLPAQWPSDAEGIEVLGVDLDLRERSNTDAETVTGETARQLCSADPTAAVLLKIDSTLRGPIAGLVNGALVGSARQVAVIAPAFPEQGRLLREGRLVVDGQQGTSLTQALGMERTALLGANFARSAAEVEMAVQHAGMRGARHVVVDADGVDNLRSVVNAWRPHAAEWLLVGSAGIARQVAASLEPSTREMPRSSRPDPSAHPGGPATASGDSRPLFDSLRHSQGSTAVSQITPTRPVLVVAGSPAVATQSQIEHLRRLGPSVLVGVESPVPRRPSEQHDVIVMCTSPAAERDSGERARLVAEAVAAWATDFGAAALDGETAGFRPGAVVLAGGATARLVCERLGVHGVRLQGELHPGVPYGFLQGGLWDGVRVVTKAGGFGTPETLLDVVHALGVSSVAERTHE